MAWHIWNSDANAEKTSVRCPNCKEFMELIVSNRCEDGKEKIICPKCGFTDFY